MQIFETRIVYEPKSRALAFSTLSTPQRVATYMADAFAARPEQESFWVILLDINNRPRGRHLVSLGSATSTVASPRDIMRVAILANAAAIVIAHNHPSGVCQPSVADIRLASSKLTRRSTAPSAYRPYPMRISPRHRSR